ncbi:MAG: hypothetical protein ACQCN6_00840 [Candidatus Bathyarchaeia archaeon]|jgi:hypothetical protein
MLNTKTAALALLLLAIITFPVVLTFANAQTSHTVEEKLVTLAQEAGDQVQTLIAKVYADPNATQKIENANLTNQFEGNATLYQNEGLAKLSNAQQALANSEYSTASDFALQALEVFRNTYSSLQAILETAGVPSDASISNQGLLDAIERELQRVEMLKEILPTNTSQDVVSLLENAKAKLLEAKTSALNGEIDTAQTQFVEAKQFITQIYQYLKTEAQQSNTWRLDGYCQKLQQQIQERFSYGKQNGIDFTAALAAKGYQSETQFMQALQAKIQNAQSQGDIQNAIQECESISQMVQQMQQSLNQEINSQQHNQGGASGGGVSGDGNSNNSTTSDGTSGNGNGTKGGR